ncbi:MAG: hypothetical protein ACR2NN_07630 [Bryobacteraceae bacterium]
MNEIFPFALLIVKLVLFTISEIVGLTVTWPPPPPEQPPPSVTVTLEKVLPALLP